MGGRQHLGPSARLLEDPFRDGHWVVQNVSVGHPKGLDSHRGEEAVPFGISGAATAFVMLGPINLDGQQCLGAKEVQVGSGQWHLVVEDVRALGQAVPEPGFRVCLLTDLLLRVAQPPPSVRRGQHLLSIKTCAAAPGRYSASSSAICRARSRAARCAARCRRHAIHGDMFRSGQNRSNSWCPTGSAVPVR
jgi:hypothetical protein